MLKTGILLKELLIFSDKYLGVTFNYFTETQAAQKHPITNFFECKSNDRRKRERERDRVCEKEIERKCGVGDEVI